MRLKDKANIERIKIITCPKCGNIINRLSIIVLDFKTHAINCASCKFKGNIDKAIETEAFTKIRNYEKEF